MTKEQAAQLQRIEDKLDLLLEKAEINWISVSETGEEKQQPLDKDVWPDWYGDLYSIPGFKIPLTHCENWLAEKGITVVRANQAAGALRGKWPGPKRSPYVDAWATFRNWVQRPEQVPRSNGRATRARDISTDPADFAGDFREG